MPKHIHHITVVAAIIFNDTGLYLIARKRPGKSNAGYWEFPGGKVEKDERPEEALKREIAEEFNAGIDQLKYYHSYDYHYPFTAIHFMFYTAILKGNKALISVDHDRIAWIAKEQMSQYSFAPGDLPAVEFILENGF